MIVWKFAIERSGKSSKTERLRYNYRKCNYIKMNEELEAVDWELLFQDCSVNECYEIFVNIYESLCEKYIPKLDENIRKNAKWMTVKIKQDINS